MNHLLWGVRILLAGIFLFTAAGKLFDYDQLVRVIEIRSKGRPIGMSRWQAALVGVAEVAGAFGVLTPSSLDPSHLICFSSAAWLAVIMVGAIVYHLLRSDSALPSIFLLLISLFIVVGRWPR
jgi:uncharacterized membrane protein YphA (DoxX/SURF4 family)